MWWRKNYRISGIVITIFYFTFLLLTGCAKEPPQNKNNICEIFREYPTWYWSLKNTRAEYNIPISTIMAVIYQESRYQAKVKPPREKILWIIPWFRPSSSYGYSQAVDGTWEMYIKDTGDKSAKRRKFRDAANFIGWYLDRASLLANINRNDVSSLYLAYHEGIGGYQKGTYKENKWILDVSYKVEKRAIQYKYQLLRCENDLPQKPWYRFW